MKGDARSLDYAHVGSRIYCHTCAGKRGISGSFDQSCLGLDSQKNSKSLGAT